MTDDARPTPLPPRPNGEGPGTVRASDRHAPQAGHSIDIREYLLSRRRLLLDELGLINKQLGIDRGGDSNTFRRDR